MVDNPFEIAPPVMPTLTMPPAPEVTAPDDKALVITSDASVEEGKDLGESSLNLKTVQRILAKHDNKESDIPTNCVEYWAAKRRL